MALDPDEPLPPPLPHEREQETPPAPEEPKKTKKLTRKKSLLGARKKVAEAKEAAASATAPEGQSKGTKPKPDTTPKASTTPPRPLEILTPGEKFGDYQILKCLSFDLVGSLYRVRKARERDEQTLLVLPPVVSESEAFSQRFQAERERLIALEHPDILSPQSTQNIKGRLSLIFPGVSAVNLGDYFETEGKENKAHTVFALLPKDVRGILGRIVKTLEFAHGQNLAHLNLNPSNILRTSEGRILIAGFGLVSIIGQDLFLQAANASLPPLAMDPMHTRLSTKDILPPEVFKGETPDFRADFYAVGVLAYWMLTGKRPEKGYTPASELVEGLPKGWDLIIEKCLDPVAKKRYVCATDILDDMEQVEELKLAGGKNAKTEASGPWEGINKALASVPVLPPFTHKSPQVVALSRLGIIALPIVLMLVIVLALSLLGEDASAIQEDAPPVAVRAAEASQANLILQASVAPFKIILPDGRTIVSTKTSVPLVVERGQHLFVVSAQDYYDERVQINATRQAQEVLVNLRQQWAEFEITAKPLTVVAAVPAEGEPRPVGIVNREGRLSLTEGFTSGQYTFVAELDDHQRAVIEDIPLRPGHNPAINIPQAPLPGTLRVRSEPQGAIIYVNGEPVGQTNATVPDLVVNSEFTISLRKPGYSSIQRQLSLQPNTRTILDFGQLALATFELVPEITVQGQPPAENLLAAMQLTIRSDNPAANQPQRTTLAPGPALDALLANIPAGNVTVSIEHPSYDGFERTFEATENARVRLLADLSPRPASLTLNVHPVDAPLYLATDGGATVPLGDQRVFSIPSMHEKRLVLSSPDYQPVEIRLNPEPGQNIRRDIYLDPVPGPAPGDDFDIHRMNMPMVWIEPGTFTLGSPLPEESRLPSEGTQTEVTFTKGYWICRYETPQLIYEALMGSNPSRNKSAGFPVESVTWDEAILFCARLTEREQNAGRLPAGYVYRLPTEAEWEYAASTGHEKPFTWGYEADASMGNFQGRYPRREVIGQIEPNSRTSTAAVAQYQPNAWGLFDVHGNVAEWCIDHYNSRHPGGSVEDWVQNYPVGKRPFRGGGWRNLAKDCRIAWRNSGYSQNTRIDSLGFRIVLGPIIQWDEPER